MHNTALHHWHTAHGGRMVDFAGWEMPIQYTSIIDEHHAVRQRAGLFDISHMGRLRFDGDDACRFLDHLLTNDVSLLKPGQVRYSLVCNEAGGILDDVLVYRLDGGYMLVVNASNREKIVDWIEQHRVDFDVCVKDETLETVMIALQGPAAMDILARHTDANLTEMRYYTIVDANCEGVASLISRTGYTGEDGFEIIVPQADSVRIWESLMASGASEGILPCGLGCRDTLRLEAGMPLYGHEMDKSMDPLTAGLSFGVKLAAGDFIGRDALIVLRDRPKVKSRVGLQLEGRRIAREGADILHDDQVIGTVTSGSFSPTLERAIAMGYVPTTLAEIGTQLVVDIRGNRVPAEVVALPFYSLSESR